MQMAGRMEENIILEKLGMFGMTRQEANIYLCLYQNGIAQKA